MKKSKKTYVSPVLTRVTFDDKKLVEFAVCKKQTQLERLTESCCNLLPYNTYSKDTFDPS